MPPTEGSIELGKMIKERRMAAGLSFGELAERVQSDKAFLYRLEQGAYQTPSPQLLERLSKALKLPLADMYATLGIPIPKGLPNFAPYLRATSDLPENAIAQLERTFERLRARHDKHRDDE
jgi:transcriptional regulator with XRE-family HTH domain